MVPSTKSRRSLLPRVLFTGALLLVQEFGAFALEPPPTGLLDDTHALSDPAHHDIAAEIEALRADIKADVWVTATSFPPSGVTPRHQARNTRRQWSGESAALLIGYDRASNSISLSFSPGLWERYPSSTLVELMRDSGRTITDTKLTLEERLVLIVHHAAKQLLQLETVRIQHQRWFQSDEKRFALILAAVLVGTTLLAAIFGAASRQRGTSSSQQHYFPDVVVGCRLGAPFGGGLIAEGSPSSGP